MNNEDSWDGRRFYFVMIVTSFGVKKFHKKVNQDGHLILNIKGKKKKKFLTKSISYFKKRRREKPQKK